MRGDGSVERLTTGTVEIDAILKGGLPKDTICLITGSPGTGKTILALQALFANCGPACRGLYLTTMSEPFYKLTRFMQGLAFFDEQKMITDISFHDLGAEVAKRGIGELPAIIADLIKELSPRILVIDSFKALHDLAPSVRVFRRLLYEVGSLLTGYACTTLLLGEYPVDAPEHEPEFAVADCILELVNKKYGVRDERYLRVIKLRGSTYASGEHAFKITAHGLEAFPRLTTSAVPTSYTLTDDRLSTGVAGLDAMLGGGLLRGSSTLVTGASGTGKTLLGLSFLAAGAQAGEEGVHISFQENPTLLRRAAANLNLRLIDDLLEFIYCSPVEVNIDEVVKGLIDRLDQRPIRRVVIDALGDLEAACWDKVRFRHYIYSMTQLTATRNINLLVINEVPGITHESSSMSQDISYLSDNIIFLKYSGRKVLERRVLIAKERGSSHDDTTRVMRVVNGKGLVVGDA